MAKHNITLASRMGKTYQSPKAELIILETQGVLCGSSAGGGMKGNSTEGVRIADFQFV